MSEMASHQIVLFLCAVFYMITQVAANNEPFKAIKTLNGRNAVDEFKKSSNVRVVYYFKKQSQRLRYFFLELDKSAEYLDLYGVKIAMCDCTVAASPAVYECGRDKAEQNVYTYRNGQVLLSLELETMFDVNSIMSNILQLVLLRQVPILQTTDEVNTFLEKNKGKFDVIFGHMKAIGTFDHRVFMEVAYAYQDKFRFAICTERKATSLFDGASKSQDKSIIWWVWTKLMPQHDEDYHSIQYRDELSLAAFANFARAISLPKMFDIPADGLEDPYTQVDLNAVHLYYNSETKQDVLDKANLIAKHFLGMLTLTLYDMDREENKNVLPEGQVIPALSINSRKLDQSLFMKKPLTTDNIASFLEDSLGSWATETSDSPTDYGTGPPVDPDVKDAKRFPPEFNIEAVETQDDQVEDAVYMTRKVTMPLDLVPALTDKTFPTGLASADTVVVTFYFPFDALCMAFLRMFGEAADRLGADAGIGLARVNCYDWTDVCALQNITTYPTMRVFRRGQRDWDYKGPMDTQEIYSTLKILELSPPVHLHSQQEVMVYLSGSASVAQTVTNVTVVGLFDKKHTHERNVFVQAAQENRQRIVYADTDIPEAADIASQMGTSLPAIILAKYDDTIQSHVVFTNEFTQENINQFVQDNRLPRLPMLTPLMFPELRARGHDFVILFTDNSPGCLVPEDSLREIVKGNQFNNISFTLMSVPGMESIEYKVLSRYTEEPTLPFLSYVNLNKGEVFNFEQTDFHKDSVSRWIGSVVSRTLQPSTMLTAGEWKPANKGYEFLKIIDWQQQNAQRKAKQAQKQSGRLSKDIIQESAIDSDSEELGEADNEDDYDADARNELFKLPNSRLYPHPHHGEKVAKHGEKSELKKEGQKHEHTEL